MQMAEEECVVTPLAPEEVVAKTTSDPIVAFPGIDDIALVLTIDDVRIAGAYKEVIEIVLAVYDCRGFSPYI